MEDGRRDGAASLAMQCVARLLEDLIDALEGIDDLDARVQVINTIKRALHVAGPMRSEPVDCVLWVRADTVRANDYNPNAVAPPEMRLLERSVTADGYTQPIVTYAVEGIHEVVDGFHRHRVGRECPEVRARLYGYLPVVAINTDRTDRADRIASTIRHNRARGKHKVEAMSDIVVELKRRNWSDEKIGRELGMDADEVLRLTQITGLAEMFKDRDFSQAWEASSINELDDLALHDELADSSDALVNSIQEGAVPTNETTGGSDG